MFKTLVREDDSTTNTNSLQSKKDGGQRQFSEEKNKFALSVLRRVRVKLEGREPDSLRKVRIVVWKTKICPIIMFSVVCWRASGFHYPWSNEHGKSCSNVRGLDCLDLRCMKPDYKTVFNIRSHFSCWYKEKLQGLQLIFPINHCPILCDTWYCAI